MRVGSVRTGLMALLLTPVAPRAFAQTQDAPPTIRHRADGQKYALVGAKLACAVKRTELFVDGTNLLNESYHEVAGVSMPGRWMTIGLTFRN